MFDFGFGELLLIAVVALLVLGPQRLPGAARTVGALLRRARDGWSSVQSEVERELQADELKRNVEEQMTGVRQTAEQARAEVEGGVRGIGKAAAPRSGRAGAKVVGDDDHRD